MPAGFFAGQVRAGSASQAATYARRYKERLKGSPGAYRQYQLKCRDAMRKLRERRRLDRLVSPSAQTSLSLALRQGEADTESAREAPLGNWGDDVDWTERVTVSQSAQRASLSLALQQGGTEAEGAREAP